MLNPEKLRKISETVEKRRKSRDKRNAQKTALIQDLQAKKETEKLIPKAEKELEKAARKGLDRVAVYSYRDSFGSPQNKIASLIAAHFSKNFRTSSFVHEEEGCYYSTDVVVHIR